MEDENLPQWTTKVLQRACGRAADLGANLSASKGVTGSRRKFCGREQKNKASPVASECVLQVAVQRQREAEHLQGIHCVGAVEEREDGQRQTCKKSPQHLMAIESERWKPTAFSCCEMLAICSLLAWNQGVVEKTFLKIMWTRQVFHEGCVRGTVFDPDFDNKPIVL